MQTLTLTLILTITLTLTQNRITLHFPTNYPFAAQQRTLHFTIGLISWTGDQTADVS